MISLWLGLQITPSTTGESPYENFWTLVTDDISKISRRTKIRLKMTPWIGRFLVANQNSYSGDMDHLMKTFVTTEQELNNVDVKGPNNSKLRYF